MKKYLWKISLSVLLIGSAFFYFSSPVFADSSTTQQQLASTLQQLINTLTAQLQQLEQQLAAQQSVQSPSSSASIAVTNSLNSSDTSSSQATSTTEAVFSDCVIKIQTSTISTSLANGSSIVASFEIVISSPDGKSIEGKHININGASYTSGASGVIFMSIGAQQGIPVQLVISEDGMNVQLQTIVFTPPIYTPPTELAPQNLPCRDSYGNLYYHFGTSCPVVSPAPYDLPGPNCTEKFSTSGLPIGHVCWIVPSA